MNAMHLSSLLLGVCVSTAPFATTQAGPAKGNAQVLGYQDAETGVFRPLQAIAPDASTPPTTGTVKVTFTVKLATSFPKGTTLLCTSNLSASVIHESTGASSIFEESISEGVALSGTTATCTTTIPYSWVIPTAAGAVLESFTGSYVLAATTATSTGAPALTGLVTRTSTGTFASATKIPASATVSTYAVSATL